MNLRPADHSDLPTLFAIHRSVFRAHIKQLWGWDEAWQRQNFAAECAAAITSVVEVGGQTIGYLQVLEQDSHLYVQNIALSADHQGQGIGSQLLRDLQSQAAARRLPLRLGAFRSNAAALSLYQRLGFRQTGETPTHTEMEWTADEPDMPAAEDNNAVLQHYFNASAPLLARHPQLLAPSEVLEQTAQLGFHPLVQQLGCYVLDDANSSDHHLLATRSPLAGCVVFLSHDGDTRAVFESATGFLAAVQQAQASGREVSDLHPALSPLAPDQAALAAFIHQLLDEETCNEVVAALIPSFDLEDHHLLRRMLDDEDFYLGEAVAMAIQKRPSQALLPMAQRAAAHAHPQVAQAGKLAAKWIRQWT